MAKLTPEEWMTEVDNGLKFRELYGREASWKRLEEDYLNGEDGHTTIGSNLVFSMGDSLQSALHIPDPEINVAPTHPMGVDRAPTIESWDNYLIKKLRLKDESLDSSLHAYLYGRAIWKLGYDSEHGYSPFYDTGTITQPSGMTLTQFDKKGKRLEFGRTSPGLPWCMAVSPHDIVVPWGTKHIDTAPWIAHRKIRLNTAIKADPKYKNKTRLEPQLAMESFVQSYLNTGVAKRKFREYKSTATLNENTRVLYNEIWEICDRSDNTIKVICFDYDRFLRDEIDAVQLVCGMPYISGTFVRHPRFFWSTPLAHYLGRIQKKEYDIELQAEKQRRINNLKFLVKKGLMSRDAMNRLISADVGAVEECDAPDLTGAIMAFPQGSNLEFSLMSRENKDDAREAIGLSRNQLGQYDMSSRRTAREATFVQMGAGRRESLRSSVVSGMYLDAMPKLNQITFSFTQRPMYALVDREWIKFKGEELQGDYLFDLSLNTKRNLSRAERKAEAMMTAIQMIQMGANPQAAFEYMEDAANDPSFERLIPKPQAQGGARQGAGAPVSGMPALPSGGGDNA
ncbi:MAG: hypothetical protein ACXABY_11135 [Candidatus Thorarchaeota archaeon]